MVERGVSVDHSVARSFHARATRVAQAQDSDGVMLSVLGRQRHAQIIYVGDPYRQIYEWRGTVNAMAQIAAAECTLAESFRFEPTLVALASRLLALLGER